MEMCYDGTLVMPSSYAVMSEDEMTYVEGGARYTNLGGLFSLIIGVTTGAAAVYNSVKVLAKVTEAAVKKALGAICSGCVGYITLVWYAAQIATAIYYLKSQGSYCVNTFSIWDYGIANYVTK